MARTDTTLRSASRVREETAYRAVLAGTGAVMLYAMVLLSYLIVTDTVHDASTAVLPAIWFGIAVGGLSIAATRARQVHRRHVAVGAVYTLGLLAFSGYLSVGFVGTGGSIAVRLPGWGPLVVADLVVVHLVIVPFQTVGYVTLGVLLASALAVTRRTMAAGVIGLFSCAGCVLPIVAAVATAVGMPWAVATPSYELSTLAFILAVAALSAVLYRDATSGSCTH